MGKRQANTWIDLELRVDQLHKSGDMRGLAEMLLDPDIARRRGLRKGIINYLAQSSDAAVTPILLDVLETDPSGNARLYAVAGLARRGGDEVEAALISALQDDDRAVRMQAAMGLAPATTPAAVEALVSALSDPKVSVRRAAAASLGTIRADRRDAIEPLIRSLEDPSMSVRVSASHALAAIGARTALPALRRAYQRTWLRGRRAIKRDIRELEGHLID